MNYKQSCIKNMTDIKLTSSRRKNLKSRDLNTLSVCFTPIISTALSYERCKIAVNFPHQ